MLHNYGWGDHDTIMLPIGHDQTMVDTQKNNNPQCGNSGEQILFNEPRKQWIAGLHIYKTIFL